MMVKCDNCGKKVNIHGKKRKSWKHHFCNRDCYIEYKRKHPRHSKNHNKKYNWNMQRKLSKLAELRKKYTKI